MSLLELLYRKPPEPAAPLASLLADLDLEPFDRESVERYKREKKEATFRAVLPQPYDWRQRAYGIDGFAYTHSDQPSIIDPAGVLMRDERYYVDRARSAGWDLRFYYEHNHSHVPVAVFLRWRRMSLAEAVATIGVPDYVANKAAQILDKSPGAVVEVDGLESNTQAYDPFLVVKLGDEEYYVEVWGDDEREFKH